VLQRLGRLPRCSLGRLAARMIPFLVLVGLAAATSRSSIMNAIRR